MVVTAVALVVALRLRTFDYSNGDTCSYTSEGRIVTGSVVVMAGHWNRSVDTPLRYPRSGSRALVVMAVVAIEIAEIWPAAGVAIAPVAVLV